jgi:hypothetical protein
MAPRPVLAADFALMAMDEAGVYRAAGRDNTAYEVRNEIQYITSARTGGNTYFGFEGQFSTVAGTPWNATAAQVQTQLEGMSNIAPGDVICTGGPWPGTITIEFAGTKAGTNVGQVSFDATGLTGGQSATAGTTQEGGNQPRTDMERAVGVALLDENGAEPNSTVKNAVDAVLEAAREQNFIVDIIPPTFTAVDVTTTVKALVGWNQSDVDEAVTQALSDYLSPSTWGAPIGDAIGWENITAVRYLELATVINNVQGVDYITALSFGTPTLGSTDVTLPGMFPLPTPGAINVTVV